MPTPIRSGTNDFCGFAFAAKAIRLEACQSRRNDDIAFQSSMKNPSRGGSALKDPVRDATIGALQRLLDPLLELLFDAGITVHEFNAIARDRAVRVATARLIAEGGRATKSRIAIMTGIPRAEVTKLAAARDPLARTKPDPNPARRVLAVWHEDPRFLAANGDPAVLPIFGRKLSFESLVARCRPGIPVRAMLDELVQLGGVECLPGQRVKAKARIPIMTGLTSRSIAALGERGRDLLETLAHNVRRDAQPLFEATAVIDDGDPEMVPVLRREIADQGRNFINNASSLLNRSQRHRPPGTRTPPKRQQGKNATPSLAAQRSRLGVTVYYFQQPVEDAPANPPAQRAPRKNLRRRARTMDQP